MTKNVVATGIDGDAVFIVPGVENPVLMVTEKSVHYQVGQDAESEWFSAMPRDNMDGIVHVAENQQGSVAMLHSLHCLNRVRRGVATRPKDGGARAHVQHCFTYLRQSVLCAADVTLEPLVEDSARTSNSGVIDGMGVRHTYRDWSAVYGEVLQSNAA